MQYDKKILNFLQKINELPEAWRKALEQHFLIRNLTNPHTKSNYLESVISFYRITNVENPKQIKKKDVEKWIKELRKREYKEWTITDYIKCFRALLKTVFQTKDYPPCISWLKPPSTSQLRKTGNMRDKILSKEEILEPKVCPRCGFKNLPEAFYCTKCALILDDKIAVQVTEIQQLGDQILEELLDDPEVEKAIKNALKRKLTQQRKQQDPSYYSSLRT